MYLRIDQLLTNCPLKFRTTDPFADEGDPLADTENVGSQADYLHIRIQQRNGRKTLTTLQGLPKRMYCVFAHALIATPHTDTLRVCLEYDPKKLLKAFKKARLFSH